MLCGAQCDKDREEGSALREKRNISEEWETFTLTLMRGRPPGGKTVRTLLAEEPCEGVEDEHPRGVEENVHRCSLSPPLLVIPT